ncbi:MAG: biotin--[acetyl-CoA-carboxylase] ligase [Ktedonobacteraceae bacterium]|nr:biotin--[acetyl-CoA-carboxylase] ligase [Ktedonobacteraceae bacterium]
MSQYLNIDALRNQLDTQLFGRGDRLFYSPVVDSTNTQAMHLARKGGEEGVVVLADNQTAGRGRVGKRWLDLPGCAAISSVVLRPRFSPHLLVMIASLAVVDAISDTCHIIAHLKWPNDVLVRDRKVAGILIETSHDLRGHLVAVAGIGVNVNGCIDQIGENRAESLPPALSQLPETATTLETACGHTVSRETFIASLLLHLERYYLALQQEAQQPLPVAAAYQTTSRFIREQWRTRLSTLGRTVTVCQGERIISGVAEDVKDNGELLLRCPSGEQVSITWGDIGYPTE